MKKLLSAAVAALAIVGSAEAATFTVDVTANPFRAPGVDGLQTRAWNLSGAGSVNFNGSTITTTDLVSVGQSYTTSLYRLVTFDAPADPDDFLQSPTSVTFDFGVGIGDITLLGLSGLVNDPLLGTVALAKFSSGLIRVAPGQGLLISVADTIFGTDGTGLVDGRNGAGTVRATFTLATIPVPAAGILMFGALAGLAMLRRRKEA